MPQTSHDTPYLPPEGALASSTAIGAEGSGISLAIWALSGVGVLGQQLAWLISDATPHLIVTT